MNEFINKIEEEKNRQVFSYGKVTVFFGVLIIFLVFFFLYLSAVSIKVIPEQLDEQFTVSIKSGAGFSVGSKIFKLSKNVRFEVSAPGYQKQVLELAQFNEDKVITVTLLPQPSGVNFNVLSGLADVKWFINQTIVGIGKKFKSDLDPGKHELKIQSKFFKPIVYIFQLAPGEVKEKIFNIEESYIDLTVIIQNGPGEITIAGQSYNDISLLKINLAAGQYNLLVNKEGFQNYKEIINLNYEKKVVSKVVRLSKSNVNVTFDVRPNGGVLLIGGKKTDPSKSYSLMHDKEYVVSYEKQGYQKKSIRFYPKDYLKKRLLIDLEEAKGVVAFNSVPNAELYINNKRVGLTPMAIQLPTTRQEISIRKEGYVEKKFFIKPEKNKKITIEKILKTIADRNMLLQKRGYKVSSIKMTMRLFKPNGDLIFLGAPRNELGQRANEFLRNVKMKRAFYMAEHEITKKQYQIIMGAGNISNLPVVNVTWLEAVNFCNKLSMKEGIRSYYTIRGENVVFNKNSEGYRLPTESEWEWVSRKYKKRSPTIYSWGNRNKVPVGAGNVADESSKGITKSFVGRYEDNFSGVAPVKSFPAEKNGLFDLFGNVSEWVGDYYSLIPYDKEKTYVDLLNEKRSKSNVIKGSSWKSGTVTELRASYREGLMNQREDVGFRIARNAGKL